MDVCMLMIRRSVVVSTVVKCTQATERIGHLSMKYRTKPERKSFYGCSHLPQLGLLIIQSKIKLDQRLIYTGLDWMNSV